jgi:uncharacterized membrane protein YfcA
MLLFIIGLLSGMIGGMGIGGGTVLIPSLVFIIGVSQHVAQGINLISFIPTSIIAIFVHSKNKHIVFKTALHLILAGVIGAAVGSFTASYISASLLRKLFGIFLLVMGIYELVRKEKKDTR